MLTKLQEIINYKKKSFYSRKIKQQSKNLNFK